MRRHGLLILAAFLLIAADQPPKDSGDDGSDKATDQEKVQGTWKVVSMEYKGKPVDKEFFKNYQLIFAGDKLTTHKGGSLVAEASFVLLASKNLRTLVTTQTLGPKKGKTVVSLYSVDGDTLKVCGPDGDKDPPKSFGTKPENDYMLIVLRRVKT